MPAEPRRNPGKPQSRTRLLSALAANSWVASFADRKPARRAGRSSNSLDADLGRKTAKLVVPKARGSNRERRERKGAITNASDDRRSEREPKRSDPEQRAWPVAPSRSFLLPLYIQPLCRKPALSPRGSGPLYQLGGSHSRGKPTRIGCLLIPAGQGKGIGPVVLLSLGGAQRRAVNRGQLAEGLQAVQDHVAVAQVIRGRVVEERFALAVG